VGEAMSESWQCRCVTESVVKIAALPSRSTEGLLHFNIDDSYILC